MTGLIVFVAYLAGFLVLAASLYYPVLLAVTALADVPPHKILTRLGMLLAAGGLIFLLRRLRLNNREALGYDLARRPFLRSLAGGWLLGVATMLIPLGAIFLLGVRGWRHSTIEAELLASAALSGLFGGLAVGFIEETFFRGAMFTAVRRQRGLVFTAVSTAALYAALHFIKPHRLAPGEEPGWLTGFELLAGAFEQFSGSAMWDSFASLVLVGVFLALLRERNGHIALAIGVHAGWVFAIKLAKTFTKSDPDAPLAWLIGHYDGITGWLVSAWLLVMIGVLLWMRSRGAGKTT
ncbi:MAG: CPBP family intramembrane glutamic endopeptidase [Pseudomonadota bacterium]